MEDNSQKHGPLRVGITGGIGCGKSYVCRLLEKRGIEIYDCDSAAKRLMRHDPELRRRLTELIGPGTYDDEGRLVKARVAEFLLASEDNAKAIDATVHPAVVSDFLGSGLLWMESALLFQAGIASVVDRVIAVTAPEELRLERVMQRDGISREKAQEWVDRQWPQARVRDLADYEIRNDGQADLEAQIDGILRQLGLSRQDRERQ